MVAPGRAVAARRRWAGAAAEAREMGLCTCAQEPTSRGPGMPPAQARGDRFYQVFSFQERPPVVAACAVRGEVSTGER